MTSKPPRTLSRRDVLKLAAAVGVTQTLLACGAEDSATTPPDAGAGGAGGTGGAGGAGGLAPDATDPDAALTDDLPRPEYTGEPGPEDLFQHGVASGDPLPDAVILWTRLTGIDASPSVEVFWEVSTRPDFAVRQRVGTFTTGPDRDFTVKVDADMLAPGTSHYYRFHALGRVSPVGRTRTAPAAGADVSRLRLAVVSCASMGHGWFHSYRELATQPDLDAVIHLGDYIYEYASNDYGTVRAYDPSHVCVTLDDYRRRYRQYRLEAMTQAAHRQHPFVCVWDDHEICNGAGPGGAEAHDEATQGPYADRKAAAVQAYMEWIPIREQADARIYRRFAFGGLVDLMMLDTRLWGRDRQDANAVDDLSRTILGADQEAWLFDGLKTSEARWRLVGQQVMMGHLRFRANPDLPLGVLNYDQWDGYPGCRQRLFDVIRDEGVDNVVVLAGDIHSSWASELTDDPNDPAKYDPETGEGALAVEFVAPSITSPGIAALQPALLGLVLDANPHIKWVDLKLHGWLLLDVTPERVQGTWMHFEYIREETVPPPTVGAVWEVRDGAPKLVQVDAPAAPVADAPPLVE